MRGHDVVAVDLGPRSFSFVQARIDYRRGDFNKLGLEQGSFDQVLCCSTIEHIGLGGRYGSAEQVDADLEAAHRVAAVLRVGGTMVLTLPVGQDDVFPRRHRVYGAERLPRLLEPFVLESEEYRVKRAPGLWEPAGRHDALAVSGSSTFYALGLFQLRPR
jgi:hypothetical protein